MMRSSSMVVVTALIIGSWAACSADQGASGASQTTPSNAQAPSSQAGSTAGTSAAQARAQVENLISAVVSPSIMAAANTMSQCDTQVQAVQSLAQNFVTQIESSQNVPDPNAIEALLQQLQPALQAVVKCVCGSNTCNFAGAGNFNQVFGGGNINIPDFNQLVGNAGSFAGDWNKWVGNSGNWNQYITYSGDWNQWLSGSGGDWNQWVTGDYNQYTTYSGDWNKWVGGGTYTP